MSREKPQTVDSAEGTPWCSSGQWVTPSAESLTGFSLFILRGLLFSRHPFGSFQKDCCLHYGGSLKRAGAEGRWGCPMPQPASVLVGVWDHRGCLSLSEGTFRIAWPHMPIRATAGCEQDHLLNDTSRDTQRPIGLKKRHVFIVVGEDCVISLSGQLHEILRVKLLFFCQNFIYLTPNDRKMWQSICKYFTWD